MSDSLNTPSSASLTFQGASSVGTALMDLLLADDIVPGSEPSYQLCKNILLYHPLGRKMAEAPTKLAQSQEREITVTGAPERVHEAFQREWNAIHADRYIRTTFTLGRVYGIASIVVGAVGHPTDKPLDPEKYSTEDLYFNVLDPLNTAGSLVLNQEPNSPNFQKTNMLTVAGQTYHRSRSCIVMNEEPIYIAYTSAAFGFTGRSVYQRALYPLKSFVQSMVTDDMVTRKAGVLVAKMTQPSSIIDRMMTSLMGQKRAMLQQARTDNVLGIGIEESIESLNMQNIDGAGGFARTNILKNAATAADMPAVMLENETMVAGFGEGTEDAKAIARYIDGIREDMQPLYDFFDPIVQHRAWNREFYAQIQKEFPSDYGRVKYEVALTKWQNAFRAVWPSLLKEPDSERVKVEDVKMRAAIATVEALAPLMDPDNKATVIQWACDNISNTDLLFSSPLLIDAEKLAAYNPMEATAAAQGGKDGEDETGNVMPFKLGGGGAAG